MKTKHAAFSLLILFPAAVRSQDTLGPCPTGVDYEIVSQPSVLGPATTPYGTLGMSNVVSAEALGQGAMSFQLRGNVYKQDQAGAGTPVKGARITTLSLGAAYGLNPYLDGFIGTNGYNLHSTATASSGLGSTFLGFQGTLPLPEDAGFRLALQLVGIWGTSGNSITSTLAPSGDQGATGYDYLETRTSTDLMARLTQSILYTVNDMGLKLHFNEGVISSFQADKRVLLVTGVGAQLIPVSPLILGLEINHRTFIQAVSARDPLWVTPSVVVRTPVHFNLTGGIDVSLSKDHIDGSRSLEPWRGFLSISYSLGTKTETRRQRVTQKEVAPEPVRKASPESTPVVAWQPIDSEPPPKPVRSEAEKQLLSKGLLVLNDVYFRTAKTILTPDSKSYLNGIAKMLARYPKLQIEVAGHTDNMGGLVYNMRLSEGRAKAGRDYMVSVSPDLGSHLTAKGYGMTQPKVDNTTESGRKFNRRIELRVLNREVLQEYNLEEQR